MKKTQLLFASCTILLSRAAYAYPPPEVAEDGICVKIVGLEQGPGPRGLRDKKNLKCVELDATRDLPLEFVVSNGTGKTVSGRFSVWMNEDWQVLAPAEETLSLAAGEVRTARRTARPGPRVLPALYPVHAEYRIAGRKPIHPIAVFRAKTTNRAFTRRQKVRDSLTPGVFRLDCGFARKTSMSVKGKVVLLPDADGIDPVSGGFLRISAPYGFTAHGIESRRGFVSHPPYRAGVGEAVCDFSFSLPAGEPARMRFYGAISATAKRPNPGDGVTLRVLARAAGEGDFRELAALRVPVSGAWFPGSADLSAFAGRRIDLRLVTNPGPKNDTSFDSCAWGDPVIEVGKVPSAPTVGQWLAREREAGEKARAAIVHGTDAAAGRYLLEDGGVRYGAGYAPGPAGLLDGVLAFTDGTRTVSIRGFECEIDGESIDLLDPSRKVDVAMHAEKGALKVAWRMPCATRADDGKPRFTRLAPGASSEKPVRVYGGFGSVFENPGRFNLIASGFVLSTRHAGVDYGNGLSLVQATDVPPDRFEVDGSRKIARLAAHNDVVFSFVPSAKGAFDAARRFAAVSGYKASAGIPRLLGRMCLDDWSGQYAREADRIRSAARYGVSDAIYLQHNWQRWGYDTKLPEVYPPKGDFKAFSEMFEAARSAGILYGIHDNYVDYYPDAEDFSYDLMCFNEDGTPLEAWYCPGSRSLSYRWLPQAIHPRLKSNMALFRDGFAPNALFLDVFTASMPKDVIDRAGRFYPAARNVKEWCDAWEECRKVFGVPDAVMVSEAGNDTQIGHIDAGESDHKAPEVLVPDATQYSAADRVPWHDMVSHGRMVLFGGGLGQRYSNFDSTRDMEANRRHGYGSDDYFCTTVAGGRSPMAPTFGRDTVRTYWMLHDVCAALAKGTFDAFEFGPDIHRQHATFSTGEVWLNRNTNECWTVDGRILPAYGFHARAAGGLEAGVEMRGGVRCGYAKAPGCVFVDARPPVNDGNMTIVASEATGFTLVSPSHAKIALRWEIYSPIPARYKTFTHCVSVTNEREIVFHPGIREFDFAKRQMPGVHTNAFIDVEIPAHLAPGDYSIRYGMYDPKGPRLYISGHDDGTQRICGGVMTVVAGRDGKPAIESWRPHTASEMDRARGINVDRVKVDFGGIVTDGAFRFTYPDWTITPLPGVGRFTAEIDLARFGGGNAKIVALEQVDGMKYASPPTWRQEGDRVFISCNAKAFAYRLATNRTMKTAAIFADGMVLAEGRPVRVYGTGDGTATVSFRGKTASAKSVDGRWMVELPPGEAGGPFEMTIDLGGKVRTIHDVMVGEVLVMAGQSNMQFRLAESTTDRAKWVDDPAIRSFSLPRLEEGEPYKPEDGWIALKKSNAGSWSALGYEIAIRRRARRGVAIGVINCYQGASVIQTWMPESLAREPRFALPPEGCAHPDSRIDAYSRWNRAGTLYRFAFSMIVPYGVTHVTWYQGESNTGKLEGKVYAELLAAMIGRWRKDLMYDGLPFTVVQIADLGERPRDAWRAIQDAQMRVPAICPNVKCVRSADVCENDGIHPPTKWRLAARIADSF